jgi:hypothetical protein
MHIFIIKINDGIGEDNITEYGVTFVVTPVRREIGGLIRVFKFNIVLNCASTVDVFIEGVFSFEADSAYVFFVAGSERLLDGRRCPMSFDLSIDSIPVRTRGHNSTCIELHGYPCFSQEGVKARVIKIPMLPVTLNTHIFKYNNKLWNNFEITKNVLIQSAHTYTQRNEIDHKIALWLFILSS